MISPLVAVCLALLPHACAITTSLRNVLYNGSTTAESESRAGRLDGPKLSPGVNATSYDWWYFDAASASTNESITVNFYNTGPRGFVNSFIDGPLSVVVSGSFANGSTFFLNIPAVDGGVVTTDSQGISGNWKGSGCTFRGMSLDGPSPTYVVTFDAPAIEVYGTFTLRSRAPAHYPCGPNVPGENEKMFPHVFWSNAVPDALADVDLSISGAQVRFNNGVGYHDKNWGDMPFVETTSSWYWGHAHLGPYSVVWFDALDRTGKEYVSGYVAKHGEIVKSSCDPGAVTVRPWGINADYPPTEATGVMQGLNVRFNLGSEEFLMVNVTTGLVLIDNKIYVRAEGRVVGSVEGRRRNEEIYKGQALFEEFKFQESTKSYGSTS